MAWFLLFDPFPIDCVMESGGERGKPDKGDVVVVVDVVFKCSSSTIASAG